MTEQCDLELEAKLNAYMNPKDAHLINMGITSFVVAIMSPVLLAKPKQPDKNSWATRISSSKDSLGMKRNTRA